MAIQRSGVEAVVAGFSSFIQKIGQINRAYEQQGKVADQMARKVRDAGNRAVAAQNALYSANARVVQSMRRVQDAATVTQRAQDNLNKVLANVKSTDEQIAAAKEKVARASLNYTEALTAEVRALNSAESAGRRVAATQEDLAAVQASAAASGLGLAAAFGQIGMVIGTVLAVAGPIIGVFKSIIGVFGSLIRGAYELASAIGTFLYNAFKKLLNIVLDVANRIKNFFAQAFNIATGILIADTIRNIGSSLQQLRADTFNALSELQRLQIQFETLMARDTARQQMIPLADAMATASGEAKELLQWVIRIAVTTPVTVEDIAQVVALGNAFGMTVEQSKILTRSTIDFISAMGLTEEHMWRIIYNFGQMISVGKLTGREFRDLAVSFVPIFDIMRGMAEEAGMSFNDFYKKALSGGVPVTEFLRRFVELVDRDFAGAAARMAKTWQGVTNNFKDFLHTVIGLEALGPVFNRFTAMAADALQNALTPQVRLAARAIGYTLYESLEQLWHAILDLGDALSGLVRAFGITTPTAMSFSNAIYSISTALSFGIRALANWVRELTVNMGNRFGNVVSQAYQWGYNMVISLSRGIAAGVVWVVNALNYVASIIAYWLRGFSPPRLLPDLPKWGTAAMTAWLEGFTQADFGLLQSVQDPIAEIFDMFVETGEMTATKAGQLFRDISEEIAESLTETGTIGESVLELIADATGAYGQEIVDLIEKQLALAGAADTLATAERGVADAEMAVEAAQRALRAAEENEVVRRGELSESVREYNKMVREGADPALLAAKMDEINAAEESAQAAYEERVAAEQRVDANEDALDTARANLQIVQEQIEAMEELVDLQERLIQQLIAITQAQIIQPEQPTAAGAGAGAEPPVEGVELPYFGAFAPTPEESKRRLEALAEQFKMETAWDRMKTELAIMFNDITSSMTTTWEKFIKDIAAPWVGLFGKDGTVTKKWNETFGDGGTVTSIWNKLFGEDGWFKTTWNNIFGEQGIITRTINLVAPNLTSKGQTIIDKFDELRLKAGELGDKLGLNIEGALGKTIIGLIAIGAELIDKVFLIIFWFLQLAVTAEDIALRVITGVEDIQEAWETLKTFVVNTLYTVLNTLYNAYIAPIAQGVKDWWEGVSTLYTWLTKLRDLLNGGLWKAALALLDQIWGSHSLPPIALGFRQTAEELKRLIDIMGTALPAAAYRATLDLNQQPVAMQPVMAAAPVTTINVSFGDTYLRDDMDKNMLSYLVESALVRAMKR